MVHTTACFFRVNPRFFRLLREPLLPGRHPLKVTEEGPFMARIAAVKFALTCVLLTAAATGPAQAGSWADRPEQGQTAIVTVAELPREGRATYGLIRQGGPFPYGKDGVVFGNRERALPAQRRGYYHEYTVPTPGSHDRGARRIVCGGPLRAPVACYYTADHYASFRMIVE
jgi:ribonuclease T1